MSRRWTAVVCLLVTAFPAFAFTQKGFGTSMGSLVPIGHEWITRRAAVELLYAKDPLVPDDPHDPRKGWTQGLAKNLDLAGTEQEVARLKGQTIDDSFYFSPFRAVYEAVVGERWVDIGGFNVANAMLPGNTNCWDAVAQEPVEIQYDHFMRRYDDVAGQGGITAATESQKRFVKYFVEAATAPAGQMLTWDGGGSSAQVQVDRNYFLFGRAAHLFEDSFSSEHTVRMIGDRPERVRQVKSYLCALGSEQHTHSNAATLDFTSGDVIWLPGTRWVGGNVTTFQPSLMKPTALVALEATKDLWAAFLRTMALPPGPQREAKARTEANALVTNWLSFDEPEMKRWYDAGANRIENYVLAEGEQPPGMTQSRCMIDLLGVRSGVQMDKVRELQAAQRFCLFNVRPFDGYDDLFDPQIHMPYNWRWVDRVFWKHPDKDWPIPIRPADTGRRVRIQSVSSGGWMQSQLNGGAAVMVGGGSPMLDLIEVGSRDNLFLRARYAPRLFLSYVGTSGGELQMYEGTRNSSYRIWPSPNGNDTIMNLYWKQFFWNDNGQPRLTKAGNPQNANAQWKVVPQQ